MPTYEYYCSKCENSFDKILKISDRQLPTNEECPNCKCKGSIGLCVGGASLVSPLSIEGLVRPKGDFRERMKQIKSTNRKNTIRDY